MAKPRERIKAQELRKSGESIKNIAKQLKVSPGTVSLWCRDVQLSPEQIRELERKARDPHYGRRLEYSRAQRRKRELKEKRFWKQGVKEVGELSNRELFLVGVGLYWGEGFKKDSQAGFANSDPAMIRLFIKWLIECCDVKKSDLSMRVTINSSHEYRLNDVQNYWAEVTGVETSSFQKPYLQTVKWKKVYDNHEGYYGVLRIKVRKSKDFLRKIYGWIDGLKLVGEKDGENAEKREKGTAEFLLKYAGSWKGTYLDSDEFWHDLLGDSYPLPEDRKVKGE